MSWPVASLIVLGLALSGGFAWYERSNPSSRTVALVATLAAMAALGRVAFAAVPDVKPTTDVVLLSGYALGGAPGFAIGALAALTSNLVFGQGPWTPWQMFAWGLTGVMGAALARIGGRRLGRVPLSVACAGAGIAFGAIMNLFTWTDTGGQTVGQYVVIAGQALPFDVAHAVANLIFCLAFGPALVRALVRFRARFEIVWRPAGAALGAAVVALAAAAALVPPRALAGASAFVPPRALAAAAALVPARALAAGDPTVKRATAYLLRAQNADGGFGAARGGSSTELYSAWVALGLAAAGRDPSAVAHGGRSVSDYIVGAGRDVRGIGDVERTMLALRAGGRPARVGGRDLVGELVAHQSARGDFGGQVNYTAFAILALRAAGRPARDAAGRRALRWLERERDPDGGFNFLGRGGASDVDDTAGALEALVAAGGRRATGVRSAAGFLARSQDLDGGFPLEPGGPSNAQSTAWAIQALVAAGRDPARVHRRGSRSPLGFLRSLAEPDGSIRYSRTSAQTPVWVTAQALAALAGRPLPIEPRAGWGRGATRARQATRKGVRSGGSARSAPARQRAPTTRRAGSPPTAGLMLQRRLALLMPMLGAVGGTLAAILA
jgi:energy-coupling factor transport system substrate-specific component